MEERVTHPEILLHEQFIQNLTFLENNINKSRADLPDLLYNFFSQFIRATMGTFNDPFKSMMQKLIYEEQSGTPRQIAAKIIKSIDYLEWPDKLSGRIYLSDIRNQIVFVLWRQHRHMIPAQWTPENITNGTEEQNKTYKDIAHCIGSKILDPKDHERLSSLLVWMHFLKLVCHVKIYLNQNEGETYETYDNYFIFNTFSGGCLHKYNDSGMSNLIWELFLDVWHYDNAG